MRLHTLVLKDISRRKTKLGLAVLSVVVAAAAIVAVVTTFSAATDGLYEESNKFGANIIVKPEVTAIPLVQVRPLLVLCLQERTTLRNRKFPEFILLRITVTSQL